MEGSTVISGVGVGTAAEVGSGLLWTRLDRAGSGLSGTAERDDGDDG
jgi:hypothetical protein